MNTPDTFPALFAAYTAIWAIIVMAIFRLAREQRELAKKVFSESENGLPRSQR